MVKLRFLSPDDNVVVKATVHKSGKLGFSTGAIKKLRLDENRSFKVGVNDEDDTDESLYLVVADESDEDSFKASKAGNYYYLRINHILDDLGIDYKKETVIYDIQEMRDTDLKYYRLTRRKSSSSK